MPRYAYNCGVCKKSIVVQHLSDEVVKDCTLCSAKNSLVKQLTTFRTSPPPRSTRAKVGEVTEEFIRDARRDLKQQKKELEDKSK